MRFIVMDEVERIERRISLHDMRVLISVVQTGSMGKAAERLATSQPAVSRSIADLEHAFGVRLLDRSPKGIVPTLYGNALVKRGIAVFDELRQGVKDLKFIADPTVGELHIGAPVVVVTGLISTVIDRLSRRYPHIAFQVVAADVGTACRALVERKVDLVLGRLAGEVVEEQMNAEILYHEPLVVAAGIRNPWTRRRKVELAELMDEPWTLPELDTPVGSLVSEAFRANGLSIPRTTVTSSGPVRSAMLASGRFLTMAPRVVLGFPTKNTALKSLPIDLPMTRRPVGIITLKNRTLNPVAKLFINYAREVAKPLAK
jgi:DNA-binding transcriptional LysR family regulator